jgi:isoleucyl-tRNA synthetase
VVSDAGESVALDLALDDELRRAGVAREIVRTLQEARKTAGLDVSDRIEVWWASTDTPLVAAWGEHGPMIAREVLAVGVYSEESAPTDAYRVETDLAMDLCLRRT